MTDRTKRISSAIYTIAAPIILEFVRTKREDLGMVTITSIRVTKDLSYADISVTSSEPIKNLPKELAETGPMIRKSIADTLSIYKTPIVRFKKWDREVKTDTLMHLIDSLNVSHSHEKATQDLQNHLS